MTQNQSSNGFLSGFLPRPSFSKAFFVALISTTVVSACAKERALPSPGSPQTLIENSQQSVGCDNFEDDFYDGIYKYFINKQKIPTSQEMQKAFESMLDGPRYQGLTASFKQRMSQDLAELFNLVAVETVRTTADDPSDIGSALEAVAAMEMGDRTTPQKQLMQDKIRAQFDEIEKTLSGSNVKLECAAPVRVVSILPSEAPDSYLGMIKRSRTPSVYGGIKALMTAYQSCQVAALPPLSAATPDLAGIKVVGTHPDKIGFKRMISDIKSLVASHPYLANYQKPAASCFDVLKSPMIYDYGGKPNTTDNDNSKLDFFTNAGSGTKVLGIDCSGYVYSSLATAGLKLKKKGKLKAAGVYGVSAKMWMNPQSNGLTCFDYATFSKSQSLMPGDILASHGHVILIESVGADPFGIAQFSSESECTAANMSVARFDFNILQSSNVKNGIGIDHFRASDYLAAGGEMGDAMIQNAVSACLAKTRGASVTAKAKTAGLVRHLGSADCMDQPVRLAHEECVASCPATPAF